MSIWHASHWYRIVSICIIYVLLMQDFFGPFQHVMAQEVSNLPQPGAMVALSPSFAPVLLQGVRVDPANPLRLDFIVDKGDSNILFPLISAFKGRGNVLPAPLAPAPLWGGHGREAMNDANRLIKYFLAALTIPEKDLWVNLSPYEKDRVIPEVFGQTDMGRDLLAQDYLLKQITSGLIFPKGEVGKKFWAEIYKQAQEKFGTTDIPVDAFNKVWIVPQKAVVYENDHAAYVVEGRLKVMLDTDYLAMRNNVNSRALAQADDIAKGILRAVIIPVLEKEVNEGKNFSQLRQVYNALVLAIWFKDRIMSSPLQKVYINQDKIAGIDIADKHAREKIWHQYVEAFNRGVFSCIRDDAEAASVGIDEAPRKYFSGGITVERVRRAIEYSHDAGALQEFDADNAMRVTADLTPVFPPNDKAQKSMDGVLFRPRDEVLKNNPGIYQGTRSSDDIRNILIRAEQEGDLVEAEAALRGFDGSGTGLDREERQLVVTPLGPISLEKIPATVTFSHQDLYATLSITAAEDPNVIEYERKVFNGSGGGKEIDSGDVVLVDGKVIAKNPMYKAPAYIFRNLFGISGVRITLTLSHPFAEFGGVESSSVFICSLLTLASMLKGAGWTQADIWYQALRIENEVLGGIAGGQGGFPMMLGGVWANNWLGQVRDDAGHKLFPFQVFSTQVIFPEDYPFYESRMAFVQLGNSLGNGNGENLRTAELTYRMGKDLSLDKDPVANEIDRMKVDLQRQFERGLREKDMRSVIQSSNETMGLRDKLNHRWLELALMPKDAPDRPAYAQKYAKYFLKSPLLQKFYRDNGDGLKDISFYSYFSRDIIASARRHGVAFFLTGSGGPKGNAVVLAETPEALQAFLEENNFPLLKAEDAVLKAKKGEDLRGYLPFRIGGKIRFSPVFKKYGIEPPSSPVPSTLTEIDGKIGISSDKSQLTPDFKAMRDALPTDEEIEEEGDSSVREEIGIVIASIRKKLQSIEAKTKNDVIDLNAPIRLDELSPVPVNIDPNKPVRWGIAPGTFDPIHWGHIDAWLEFINQTNALVVVVPSEDPYHLVEKALEPFVPLLRYAPPVQGRKLFEQAQWLSEINKGYKLKFIGNTERSEYSLSRITVAGIYKNERHKIFLPRVVQQAIADGSLYVDHPGVKALWMKSARDPRPRLAKAIQQGLNSRFPAQAIGFGSIDISSGKFNKGDALRQICKNAPWMNTAIYFGNEFKMGGNDEAIAAMKKAVEAAGKKLIIFSVDEDPLDRSKVGRENTIWIGTGAEASARVMRQIADAIAAGEPAILVRGEGVDADKRVSININELKAQGMMLYDVDGTIIMDRADNLTIDSQAGREFTRLLAEVKQGIISGQSREVQLRRIVGPQKGLADLSRLFLYVNTGKTLVTFNAAGEAAVRNFVPVISARDDEILVQTVARQALDHFGMNTRELEAYQAWYYSGGLVKYNAHYNHLIFDPWWTVPNFKPVVVTEEELIRMQQPGNTRRLSLPFIIHKKVQCTVALFPGQLPLVSKVENEENPGGIDLTKSRAGMPLLNGSMPGVMAEKHADIIRRALGFRPEIISVVPIHNRLEDLLK